MSENRVAFFVALFLLPVGAALFWSPTTKPAHWTVVEVRYLKNGACSFVAEWAGGVRSVPQYIKAESPDSKHQLCPQLGDTLNPPRLDLLTISTGTGDQQRFADVTEQWRGREVNPR